jgi:ComF family protein
LQLHFDWARAAARASGVVLEVIHRYKYRGERWFEPFLGELLATAAEPTVRAGDWDWLVPVPLHPMKEREREFNQAACLARRLGAATGVPVASGFLRRVHYTSTQTRLSRGRRRENVVGAFEARDEAAVAGRRLILIDDVLTTGATTSECARVLKACGAEEVGVWTVARGV